MQNTKRHLFNFHKAKLSLPKNLVDHLQAHKESSEDLQNRLLNVLSNDQASIGLDEEIQKKDEPERLNTHQDLIKDQNSMC